MKPIVELHRNVIHANGAFGILVYENLPLVLTLERTFEPDNRMVIPEGDSNCHLDFYNRGGYKAYEIEIPGHTRVLMHAANGEDQLRGCMASGTSWIWFRGKRGVGQSKKAHNLLMKTLDGLQEFTLRVFNPQKVST